MVRTQSKQRSIFEGDDNIETHAEPDRQAVRAMFKQLSPLAKAVMAKTATAEDAITAVLGSPDKQQAAALLRDMTTSESSLVIGEREFRVPGQRQEQVILNSAKSYVLRLRVKEVEATKTHATCVICELEASNDEPLIEFLTGLEVMLFLPNEWKTAAFASHREGVDLKISAVLQVTLKGSALQVVCSPIAVKNEDLLERALQAMVESVKKNLLSDGFQKQLGASGNFPQLLESSPQR